MQSIDNYSGLQLAKRFSDARTRDYRGLLTGSASAKEIAGFSVNQSSAALNALTNSPLSVTGTETGSAVYIFPTDTFAYSLDTTTGSLVANHISGTTVTGPGRCYVCLHGRE